MNAERKTTYWDLIKESNFKPSQEFDGLRELLLRLEAEIDKQGAILGIIQGFLEALGRNKEPTVFGMSLVVHYLWHFNHCLMFYTSIAVANFTAAGIMLRAMFENFASLMLILSDKSTEHEYAKVFFEHTKLQDNRQYHPWYAMINGRNGKKLNFYSLCQEINEFTQNDYSYDVLKSYSEIFRQGSVFIHPSGKWTGQWLKFSDKLKIFEIEYTMENKYFEQTVNAGMAIIQIVTNIYSSFFTAGGLGRVDETK